MADRLFNSQVDLYIKLSEDTLGASSTYSIGTSDLIGLSITDTPILSNIELLVFNTFNSLVSITTDNISDIESIRELNSISNISTNNTSEINIFSSFSSLVNINSQTNEFILNYKLGGYKKLEYLTNSFTSDHLGYYYPKFKDLIRVFLRYLDYYPIFKTLTVTNNNNLNKIFPEFLNYYINLYFKDIIDLTKYELRDSNKQLFLLLSRLLNNSKGTQKSFSYLFRSLTNIRIANQDIQIAVDKIITDFIENESWWTGGLIKYYDGIYDYDGGINHEADFPRPFTYQFKIDQSRETMLPLIRSVHPAGFQQEFLIEMNFEDTLSVSESFESTNTYYHFYSYGEPNKTWYTYDGTIDYSGSHQN